MTYFFDGDEFEFDVDVPNKTLLNILNKCDKSVLIDIITDYVDKIEVEEYFEDELKDLYEERAYNEYLDCKESEREFEHLYFEFITKR